MHSNNIAALIKQVARGERGSENLNQDEARQLFAQLLLPEADQLQLGAFLIAQRMKGESSAELAGFVEASRSRIAAYGTLTVPDRAVDLPCYAGKRRAGHACLAAAIKARDAGIPVFVHGVEFIDGRITAWQVLQQAGFHRATSLEEAASMLVNEGLVYADLSDLCPDLFRIYQLRQRLGVRTFSNTVARLLNPLQCPGQLNGFFHTPYADYMAQANVLLGQHRSLIFMGAEGEPELYADRQKVVKMQCGEEISDISFEDCGAEPYPRKAVALDEILTSVGRMSNGDANKREMVTVERMQYAFSWAADHTALNTGVLS